MFFALDILNGNCEIVAICEEEKSIMVMINRYFDPFCIEKNKKYEVNCSTENNVKVYYLIENEFNEGYIYNSTLQKTVGMLKILQFPLNEAIENLLDEVNDV